MPGSQGARSREPSIARAASASRQRDAASAVANGAVSAAGSFGEDTAKAVSGAVTESVSGVKAVLRAPLRDTEKS